MRTGPTGQVAFKILNTLRTKEGLRLGSLTIQDKYTLEVSLVHIISAEKCHISEQCWFLKGLGSLPLKKLLNIPKIYAKIFGRFH